jgi:hypothetical protein
MKDEKIKELEAQEKKVLKKTKLSKLDMKNSNKEMER